MPCTARIRPFRPAEDIEVACELDEHELDEGDDLDPPGGPIHSGVIRDYAFPGSETRIDWHDNDWRTFHDEWPGSCQGVDLNRRPPTACPLPAGHRGGHV